MKIKIAVLKMVLVTAGAIIFNIVFWQEKMALNAIFFDAFVLGSVFYLYPAAFTKPEMKWLMLAHVITVVVVILHNTLLAKIAFSATLLLVVVFTQYLHRSVWYAAGSALTNYVLLVFTFFENLSQLERNDVRKMKLRKTLRFIIIPLLLLSVFIVLYSLANAVFQNYLNETGIALQKFAARLLNWYQWKRFGFLLLGLLITGGLLMKAKQHYYSERDIAKSNDLWRKKHDLRRWKNSALFDLLTVFMGRFANGILALRNENTVGIISLALLNVLLLAVNSIDIIYVWFGFTYTPDVNLKDIVHEGTGMLIFSIVLAMAVLLFFFRGNLNFYKKNKWLRYGAYGWILQNAVLVISVLLRDYYYIQHMGLAYKRIGVLFFLLMVLAGLITVFIKIHQKKTAYYLLRVNGWFAIALLVAASCIDWDETMASYNLARKNSIPIDVRFLLTLNDKALPLLEANPDVLDRPLPAAAAVQQDYARPAEFTARQLFEQRKRHFMEEQQQYSWLSWNRADAWVKNKFRPLTITSSLKN